MTSVEEYLSKANDEYKKGEEYKELANKHFNNYAELIAIYRIESVSRVLDFIRDEYRAGRICDLETLLCHCQNKLNGNIDGTELDLDRHLRGVPFKKVGESNADTNS
jgi:hypothetical protein|nr:MAG TPA: hypothetical protein [Bacteriophage sp.]